MPTGGTFPEDGAGHTYFRVNSSVAVCHLIHDVGPGGAERLLVDLASVAGESGIKLSVVSLMRPAARSYMRDLETLGVEVRSLELEHRWDPRAFARGLVVARELAPDIIHSHLKHADLVGARIAKCLGTPQVSTLHVIEDGARGPARVKRQLVARIRNGHAARVIAVSEAQRRWYVRSFAVDPDRVVVIHNGVTRASTQTNAACRLRADWDADSNTVVAVMVALMRPGKGHEELLEAIPQLRCDDLRVVLVGDGEARTRLTKRADALGLGRDRVIFAGFRDDVDAVLAAADLIVHPTRSDALPTALIHALAAGCPSVASEVGGVPEVLGDDCGILVPAGDVDALAKAVADLAGDHQRRVMMGLAARRRFAHEFTAERWAGRLRALYDDVLAEARR